MIYNEETWPADSSHHPSLSQAAAKTERLFHTLERESHRVGLHHHPGRDLRANCFKVINKAFRAKIYKFISLRKMKFL